MLDTCSQVLVRARPDAFDFVPSGTSIPGQGEHSSLPRPHLILGVADYILDRRRSFGRPVLGDLQERLWREDPATVAEIYDELITAGVGASDFDSDGRHGLLAERLRELRRPLPTRDRLGLTLRDISTRTGIDRTTLAVLMEEHGYLELVPYGGNQRRRLVTQAAFDAELGHNVDPSTVRLRIEGAHRTSPFPVFYEEALDDILWTLDYEGLVRRVRTLPDKKARLGYLLEHHPGLPASEMTGLTGYGKRTVETAKARASSSTTPTTPSHSGWSQGSSGSVHGFL